MSARPELLSALGLSQRFRDGSLGLDAVDLSIREGDYLLLAGRNGAGKSLLSLRLAGLRKVQEGRISYRGSPSPVRPAELRKRVGIVLQDAQTQVIGQTLLEDAAFGPSSMRLSREECEHRARGALERVSLGDLADRNPVTLSGGELRRLAVAGLIAMGHEILILDEPFANLDYPSIKSVLSTLEDIRSGGATIVVLTHEIEKVLAHANRIAIMEKGRIAFDGDPDALSGQDFEAFGLHDPFRTRTKRSELSWLAP